MRGPIPRKTTKPVVAPTMMSVDVPRSSAIWAIPGVNIEEAKGERTDIERVNRRKSERSSAKKERQTSHEGYDSNIKILLRLRPIPRVFFVLFRKIHDLYCY